MKPVINAYLILLPVMLFCFQGVHAQGKVYDHTKPPVDTSAGLTAPAFEEMPVYRLQLRLTTGRTDDAGTDSPVYVQMNTANEKFFLVKGIDNFIQGSTVTYDVLIDAIRKVKDIDFIKFGISGDDGLCLQKIELLLNNYSQPIFTKEYPGQKGTCIDNGSSTMPATLVIAGNEVRASEKWNYAGSRKDLWRPPLVITDTWVKDMIEASIGNQIYQEGGLVKWGTTGGRLENQTLWGSAVEIERVNSRSFHVDLDLEADVTGPNPEIDVDFDIELTCENGSIKTAMKNARLDTDLAGTILTNVVPIVTRFLGAGIGFFTGVLAGSPATAIKGAAVGLYAAGKISNALFSFKFPDIKNPRLSQGCTQVSIESNGSIRLR